MIEPHGVTASSLESVRRCMDAAEGTEFDLKTLRELAEKHPQQAEYSFEELALVEDAKQWAVLMASGLVRMGDCDFLDKRSREHVHAVADTADEEIDSRRPTEYWLAQENEAQDAAHDEPAYFDVALDTESYDNE